MANVLLWTLYFLPYGLKDVRPRERPLKDGKSVAFFGSSFVEDNVTYKTVEHYFQSKKASYFKDLSTATAIINAKSPKQTKAPSHQIHEFDQELWEPIAMHTMFKGGLL